MFRLKSRMRHKALLICSGLVLIAALCATLFALQDWPSGAHAARLAAGPGDWSMFMHDSNHGGANLSESAITAANASTLALKWKFTTGDRIVASPITSAGVLYMGSWDGYEYAINATTGKFIWKYYVGITSGQAKPCYGGGRVGPTSSPTINNGVLYVAGGDNTVYAINATTGAFIWRTPSFGPAPIYLWSSPLFYNNAIYLGISGFCDPPYAQGKVVELNPATGGTIASLSLFSGNQTGAPVMASLTVNSTTNKIFVTTGNPGSTTYQFMPYSESILALDPATLRILDHWQVPASDQANDIDFIASPTLFTINGVNYIGAENKNGYYYVLRQDNLAAGPVWKRYMDGTYQAIATDNDSTGSYYNGVIYIGGAALNGTKYYGSVSALNALTGQPVWPTYGTIGPVQASVTCTSSLVIDAQGSTVEVRSLTTGKVLFHYTTANRIQGTPIISNGVLYAASRDHSVYAFTINGQ